MPHQHQVMATFKEFLHSHQLSAQLPSKRVTREHSPLHTLVETEPSAQELGPSNDEAYEAIAPKCLAQGDLQSS
ncbi:hypothetical protein ACLESD_00415 [Pyxidicoccus sp. 3LFB2]